MDAVRVVLLREVLAGTEWLGATRRFAGVLRGSVVSHGGGLLLVGSLSGESLAKVGWVLYEWMRRVD